MKPTLTLIILGLITTLVSCSDNVASNSKPGNPVSPTTTTPTIEADQFIRSHINRSRGAAVISYVEETNFILANSLPTAYRVVPDKELDDEGTDEANIVTRETLGRPQVVCGVGTFENITARISDCSAKNGATALWSGTQNGASGEGDWQLVAKTDGNKELWFDARTRMIWSDEINLSGITTFNWCQAAGNDQNATETSVVDCNATAQGISVCHNLVMEEIGTQVEWRLPTRNDYLQADLDGLRFVLRSTSTTGYWTATLKANVVGRSEAWKYQSTGTLTTGNLTTTTAVRCVGVPRL